MTDPDRTFNGGQVVFRAGVAGQDQHSWYAGSTAVGLDDPNKYWDKLLDDARRRYGDSGMHWASGKDLGLAGNDSAGNYRGGDRYLVYGDGTRVPESGEVTWQAPDGKRYTAQPDGTYQVFGSPDKVHPASYSVTTDGKLLAFDKDGNPLYAHPDPSKITQIRDDPGWTYDKATGRYVPTENNPDATPPGQGAETSDEDGGKPSDDENGKPSDDSDEAGSGGTGESGGGRVPEGVELLEVRPKYPDWAEKADPTVGYALTSALLALRRTLGKGEPAQSNAAPVPYNVSSDAAGVKQYGTLKTKFETVQRELDLSQKTFAEAVAKSSAANQTARTALANAITKFNETVATVEEPNFGKILDAEITALTEAREAVARATSETQDPGSPGTGIGAVGAGANPGSPQATDPAGTNASNPGTPASPDTAAPSTPSPSAPTDTGSGSGIDPQLASLLQQIAATPSGTTPQQQTPQQQQNPFQQLGSGTNPFGSGIPGLTGGSGTSDLGQAIKAALGDTGSGKGGKSLQEQLEEASGKPSTQQQGAVPTTPQTPAAPVTPGTPAQTQDTPAPAQAQQAAAPAATPATTNQTPPPAASSNHVVNLGDGKTTPASSALAADVAEKALKDESGVQDPAAKFYEEAGKPLPSTGLPGAQVDPQDAKPAAFMKWEDGSSKVVVAPGEVADGKGGRMSFADAIAQKPDGYLGIFDPSAKDATLQSDGAGDTTPHPDASDTKPSPDKPDTNASTAPEQAKPDTNDNKPTPPDPGGNNTGGKPAVDVGATPSAEAPTQQQPQGTGTQPQQQSEHPQPPAQQGEHPQPTSAAPAPSKPQEPVGVAPGPSPFATPGLPAPEVSTQAERDARGEK